MTNFGFTAKQRHSIAAADGDASRQEINLWHGAIRSGKTVGSLVRFLMQIADAPTSGEIVLIGRTRDTLYRNIIAPMQDRGRFGEYADHVRYNRGAPTANILGRTVHVIGASDARAETVIRGLTVAVAYVDEVSLVAEEFFNQLMGRCSVPGAWVGCTTNPDGPQHWLKQQWIDRASWTNKDGTPGSHRIFHFTLADNREHLPAGLIEGYERQYTGLWARRMIDGEWAMADGVVFDMFNPARHVVDTLPDMARVVAVGVDFGTTNPTSGVRLGVGVDGRLYVMDEWAPRRGAAVDELEAGLRVYQDANPADYIYVDPSASPLKAFMQKRGWSNYANGANKVGLGIGIMAALFSTGQLLIHRSCTHLLDEIPGYVWDAKVAAKGEDSVVKLNDHWIDAARYAVATSRPFWQPLVPNMLPDKRLDTQ